MTWQDAIDKLVLWKDPEYLREDDLIPPTEAALRMANFFAKLVRTWGAAAPYRMLPDGDGGVAFEAPNGISIEISEVGQVEIVRTKLGKVVSRETIY